MPISTAPNGKWRCFVAPSGSLFFLLLLLLISPPSQAVYKCVVDKTTAFQELPCQAGAVQSVIRTPTDVTTDDKPTVGITITPIPPTDQEKLDVMENERLRRDAAYVLRDKLAQLANQQAFCERSFSVSFSRGGPNGGITGATFPQSTIGETNAAAGRCIARTNTIQQEVGAARAQCVTRGCPP